MHSTHIISRVAKDFDFFDRLTQFALIISGLGHDVGHTGRTNLFEINSLSELAIRYHDKSVLEQYHAALTIEILRNPDSNIVANLPKDDYRQFRKMLVSNILYTDMTEHFKLIKDFESRQENKFGQEENDVRMFTAMIIHISDFSGVSKKFPVSHQWSGLVNQEFINQYREEGLQGYPQQAFFKDLDKTSVKAKSEIGFLKVIVRPLHVTLSKFLNDGLRELVENLDETIIEWEKVLAKALEEEKELQKTESPKLASVDKKKGMNVILEDDEVGSPNTLPRVNLNLDVN